MRLQNGTVNWRDFWGGSEYDSSDEQNDQIRNWERIKNSASILDQEHRLERFLWKFDLFGAQSIF